MITTKLSTVIELNKSDSENTIFCLHTSGGGITYYENMAHRLSHDAKFIGLEDPVIYDEFDYASLPELAEYHLDSITQLQNSGPYTLFGYCSAAPLAYEVGCQLKLAGEDVKVVLFGSRLGTDVLGQDPGLTGNYAYLRQYLTYKYGLNLDAIDWASLDQQPCESVFNTILAELVAQNIDGITQDSEWVSKGLKSTYLMQKAIASYVPQKSSVDLDVYDRFVDDELAKLLVPWCNWSHLISGQFNFIAAPKYVGDHNDVLRMPYLDNTVKQLKEVSLIEKINDEHLSEIHA